MNARITSPRPSSPADRERRRLPLAHEIYFAAVTLLALTHAGRHLIICQVSHGASLVHRKDVCSALSPPQNSNKELCSRRNHCRRFLFIKIRILEKFSSCFAPMRCFLPYHRVPRQYLNKHLRLLRIP